MPYPGVPEHLTEKMERCVDDVLAKHKGEEDFDKSNAVAICKSQIVGERSGLLKVNIDAPIRSLGEGRYQAYAVLFNDEETKDAYGTYFDQKTEYALDWYRTRPWLYEHSFHPDLPPVQARVGQWDETGMDETGVWVKGELDRHHKYRQAVAELIAEDALYPSSGTLSYAAQVEEDGHVRFWPIAEVSSTVSPANWQMILDKESISPVVRSFLQELGGIEMSEDTKQVNMFMRAWEAFKAVFDAEEEGDPDLSEDTRTSDPETPDEETQEVDPLDELRTTLDGLQEQVDRLESAIRTIDSYLEKEQPKFEATRKMVRSLAESRADQLKDFVDGRKNDWTSELFVASRNSPEVGEDEVDKIKQEANAGDGAEDDGGGIFGKI